MSRCAVLGSLLFKKNNIYIIYKSKYTKLGFKLEINARKKFTGYLFKYMYII